MVWISHVYFIHSLVYGHLGCFHLGSIMNGAAVHIQQALRRHMFSFPLGIYLGVDLLKGKNIPQVSICVGRVDLKYRL